MGEFLEGLLLKALLNASPESLEQMVREDTNLVEWCLLKYPFLPMSIRLMRGRIELGTITGSRILTLLRQKRPDLAEKISLAWLDKQVAYAKWLIPRL